MIPEKFCYRCMREITGESDHCPNCGFSREQYKYEQIEDTLPLEVILNGRYLIGEVFAKDPIGFQYHAYDLKNDHPVTLVEFFPSSALRNRNQVIFGTTKQDQISFQNGLESLKSFISHSENISDSFEENHTLYYITAFEESKQDIPLALSPAANGTKRKERPLLIGVILGLITVSLIAGITLFSISQKKDKETEQETSTGWTETVSESDTSS